jgi:hypothetical protein
MTSIHAEVTRQRHLTLAALPTPGKILATCVLATLAIGMLGALGQIIVHDIIPTFFSDEPAMMSDMNTRTSPVGGETDATSAGGDRGDLFADLETKAAAVKKPIYENEQFVWTLRWSHIHLFGINMIFILLGGITFLLDAGVRLRSWLIALPFVGVAVDILAMWLKAFVSPVFFWLHLPGGGLFALIFAYVSLRAFYEMWLLPK